jgi:hypothetical protein
MDRSIKSINKENISSMLPKELVSIITDYIDVYNIIDKHKRLMEEYIQRVTFNERDCDVSVDRGNSMRVFYFNYRSIKHFDSRYWDDRICNIYDDKNNQNINRENISPNYIHQRLWDDV